MLEQSSVYADVVLWQDIFCKYSRIFFYAHDCDSTFKQLSVVSWVQHPLRCLFFWSCRVHEQLDWTMEFISLVCHSHSEETKDTMDASDDQWELRNFTFCFHIIARTSSLTACIYEALVHLTCMLIYVICSSLFFSFFSSLVMNDIEIFYHCHSRNLLLLPLIHI
jgi:hypothetical protein